MKPDVPPTRDAISRELDAQLTRYAGRVSQAAGRYGLSGSDIDEVFQEVRIRLWQSLGDAGNIAGVPASYVYRTALSAAVDLIRRRRAQRGRSEVSEDSERRDLVSSTAAPDAVLEENALASAVEQEILQLPDDRAVAVRMHLMGYGRAEIGALMGWSEARTRHLIYRGLARLRERLRERGIAPDRIE